MKHENLRILEAQGFRVPKFAVAGPGEKVDLGFSDGKLFAVRSSFGAEDSEEHSFAGQFDSFLNVSREDVPQAVEKVRASARKANIAAYTQAKDLQSRDAMHVIVQEMVDAQLSGVVFTANPMGILNETVIVVGVGLGNNVVEDKVSTTAYYYNLDDGLYHYDRQKDAPVLEESLLRTLIDDSSRIRAVFGREMDIEFAVSQGAVYYLQARPITTLSTRDPIILDNSNIVESYPGISLPLTQDFVKSIYHGIFYSCILRLSGSKDLTDRMDPRLKDMTDIANWRIYYRISNWYAALKLLPCSGKLIPVWQNMLGVGNRYVSSQEDIQVGFGAKLRILGRFLWHLLRTPQLMEGLNARFAEQCPMYRRQIDQADSPEELLAVYEDIRARILSDWDLTLINDLYTFIFMALAGKGNSTKISDIKNLESMKPSLALNALVETARAQGMDSPEYLYEADAYIDHFGDRVLGELKLETRTYRTDPHLLDAGVCECLKNSPVPVSPAPAGEKSWNLFVSMAKSGIRNREISRLNRSRIFGLSRAIFLRIGSIYARQGRLEDERDVFYLRMAELREGGNLTDIVAARKQEQLQYEQTPPYSRLVFAEKIIDRPVSGSRGQVLDKPDLLTGIGTSAGTATGRVLVIDQPDDRMDTTGKILVTRSTDPGWVFLLQRAAGIIAEKGSLLSHTAIISRELHKPAVVHVKDCTRLLRSGDLVRIDADEGRITILERCESCECV